jgi:D-3-phosphoglycerate dehydrogenase / 2-oxoglutarate reductase
VKPRRILVTPRSVTQHGHPALDRLRTAGFEVVMGPRGRQPSEAELLALLPDCAGYLAGVEPVGARVLGAAPELRVISRNGVGVDNVDLAAARDRGIEVLRADGANSRGVAELTIGLILSLARAIPAADAALKRGEWVRREGLELEGRTLGIMGCGRIGLTVAGLAVALGLRVIAHDPFAPAHVSAGAGFRLGSVEEIWRESDLLSLHCPPDSSGAPMLNAATIAALRPGVLIVNTARFDHLDRDAVFAALERGHIGGLALDVFAEEPPADHLLVRHPRVIATPHIGGYTRESVDRAVTVAVDNLLRVLNPPTT